MDTKLRSGDYVRYVYFGGRTIKDGEAAVVWKRNGAHKQIIGPQRVVLFCSIIRFLTRYKAEPHQYLKVKYRDGRVEKIKGPYSIFENPVLHDGISVHDGTHLQDSNDCIIVYQRTVIQVKDKEVESNSRISEATEMSTEAKTEIEPFNTVSFESNEEAPWRKQRYGKEVFYSKRIVRGPALFIPKSDELVHQFIWSIPNKNGGLMAKKSMFQVLQTNCNHLWKIKLQIITADLITFEVILALNYQIDSLFKCAAAKDPIQKMHASILADAQLLGTNLTSDELKPGLQRKLAALLTQKQQYPSLCDTARACGLRIESVQVVKFLFSPQDVRLALLRQEHDAIQLMYDEENDRVVDFLHSLKTQLGVDMTKFLCSSTGTQIANNVLSRSTLSKISTIRRTTNRNAQTQGISKVTNDGGVALPEIV